MKGGGCICLEDAARLAVSGEERQAKALGQKSYLHDFLVGKKSVQPAKES